MRTTRSNDLGQSIGLGIALVAMSLGILALMALQSKGI